MENLQTFIRNQVESGKNKRHIQEKLLAVGWSEDEVDTAYAEALKGMGVPMPNKNASSVFGKKATTLEIVLNFFSFILLGIIVIALGSLYFEIIDKYFPDPIGEYGQSSFVSTSAVYYSIAALFVSFPLYFFALRMWFRKFRKDEKKVESRMTKWITYIVLLVSSIAIVGDLIAILSAFLQGELGARFFLKAFTILVIAGMIFGFYFLERRKVQYGKDVSKQTFQYFGWGFCMVIILGITLGFLAVGSPKTERARVFDHQRSSDLADLAQCIDAYATTYKRLPRTLADLETSPEYCWKRQDPETGGAYAYRIVTESQVVGTNREGAYELCATFSLASSETLVSGEGRSYDVDRMGKWLSHGAGRACFTQLIVLEDLGL